MIDETSVDGNALATWDGEGGSPGNGGDENSLGPEPAPAGSCEQTSANGCTGPHQSSPLRLAIAELERAFGEFCVLPFKRKMPCPVITIQTKGRSRAAGWFWQDKWQNGRPEKLPEINIVAEYLAEDIEDIAEVLLHEMVHFSNYLDRIRDCSSSQYHNRKFRDRCAVVGLTCEKQGRRGWGHTTLSPALRQIVRAINLHREAFQMYRVGPQYTVVEAAPEQRQRRWTCECKKSKVIYASRGLDVTCNKCLKVYKEDPLL